MNIGDHVAHFKLVQRLGKGGMGEVWLAQDLSLGRAVALKVLAESIRQDQWAEKRFRQEATILASLNHPNIAQIYELEEVSDPIRPNERLRVIVMELVEGPGFEQGRTIPWQEALALAKQLAEALQAAHERGVVHGDLKPANLRLDKRGQLKVLDFGLARLLPHFSADDPDKTQDFSSSGSIAGTPAYMAPELIQGGRPTDKSDIWAFGCTIYELVTGRRLVAGTNLAETVGNVLSGKLNLAWPKDTPRSFRRVLSTCLAANPQQRPTAAQLLKLFDAEESGTRWGKKVWALAFGLTMLIGVLLLELGNRGKNSQPLLDPQGRLPIAVVVRGDGPGAREMANSYLQAATALPFVVVVSPREARIVLVGREDAKQDISVTVEEPASKRQLLHLADLSPPALAQVWPKVANVLRLEHTRRELLQEDEFFAFLVSYAHNPDAAISFRDGVQFYLRTRYADAEKELDESWRADPEFWPAPLVLALSLRGQAEFQRAQDSLKAAIALCPQPNAAESVVLESFAAFVNDELSRQLEAGTRALKFFPNSTFLLYRTARLLRQMNRPEEALPLLEQLTKKPSQQQFSPMWETLAHCQLLVGKYKKCLQTCEMVRERFPTRYQYDLYTAYAHWFLGDVPAARFALAQAIRKYDDFTPRQPMQRHQIARYWASCIRWREEEARQWQAVIEEADKGLHEAGQDRSLLEAKAEALLGLDRVPEAFSVVLSLGPAETLRASELVLLARIHHALGHTQEAEEALARFASIWPTLSEFEKGFTAYNASTVWAEVGSLGEAAQWLARALDFRGAEVLDLLLDPDLEPMRRKGLIKPLLDQLKRWKRS